MAENHPVAFQWVVEAKTAGARLIHVDPRFTRTSALADLHVPLRAGTDIAFLGGLIREVIERDAIFRDYVVPYTNAATILREDYLDTDELDGRFSGFDAARGGYDPASWAYRGGRVTPAVGDRTAGGAVGEQAHGAHAADLRGDGERDDTLRHPRCVYQVLRRHFARYTPEMVEEVCGVPRERLLAVADALIANSGPERTSAIAYAVGWTQHTTGVQNVRAASILQLLLGNVGRPGGGIMALRGHASIQGSTDIPTLYNILPGYLPMPPARDDGEDTLARYLDENRPEAGFWHGVDAYAISLLTAWWGESATAENDYGFGHLPRIGADHSHYRTTLEMLDGKVRGFFVMGENPLVGTANSRLHRLAFSQLDWMVVRDMGEIEAATWWRDGAEVQDGETRPEDIGTEVFLMPAAAHTEKAGTFTNTERLLQWREQAVEPPGDARSELWFMVHLGRRVRERLAGSEDPRDRAVLDLTWDYPLHGPRREPDPEDVLREIGGVDAEGRPLDGYAQLEADGSTACGCWIYSGVTAGGVNRAARRRPGAEQGHAAPEWGWAWPMNRRILYNRASAAPDGSPWSERKRWVWWDAPAGTWTGEDEVDFPLGTAPGHRPPDDATGPEALAGDDPFIMQADGKGWLFAPSGLVDGPLPAHYEPEESPVPNALYPQRRNPVRRTAARPDNAYHPSGGHAGAEVFPFVFTTYRLTEHHAAGGMSRWLPRLAELQPEMFVEVSPALARERGLENAGWATIVTARGAIEARVLVTERMAPLRIGRRTVHQVGLPFHWGSAGVARGDPANELLSIVTDPNVHIGEYKAATCDVVAGRRPRGPGRRALVEAYRRRAGIADDGHGGGEP